MRLRRPLLVASLLAGLVLVGMSWLRDRALGYPITVEVGVAIGLAGVLVWFERKLAEDVEERTDRRLSEVEQRLGQRIMVLEGLDEVLSDDTEEREREARAPIENLRSRVSRADVVAALRLARERRGLSAWALVNLSPQRDGAHAFIDIRQIEADGSFVGAVLNLSSIDVVQSANNEWHVTGLDSLSDTVFEWRRDDGPDEFFSQLREATLRTGGFTRGDWEPSQIVENLRLTAAAGADARSGDPDERLAGELLLLIGDQYAVTTVGIESFGKGIVLDGYEVTKPFHAQFGRDGHALPSPSAPPGMSDENWDLLFGLTGTVLGLREFLKQEELESLLQFR